MAVPDNLLSEIRRVLSETITDELNTQATVSDWFETYIFSLVVQAAKLQGANVYYEDVHGKRATEFHFRTSPGYLSSTRRPYTHAVLDFGGDIPPLEAHLGIRYSGYSGVTHEWDVSVLSHKDAEDCRKCQTVPKHTSICLAVECKYYVESSIHLGLARSFIGLLKDMSSQDTKFFVINTSSANTARLIEYHHKLRTYENLIPDNPNDVTLLVSAFQKIFNSYKLTQRVLQTEPEG